MSHQRKLGSSNIFFKSIGRIDSGTHCKDGEILVIEKSVGGS